MGCLCHPLNRLFLVLLVLLVSMVGVFFSLVVGNGFHLHFGFGLVGEAPVLFGFCFFLRRCEGVGCAYRGESGIYVHS